MLPCCHARQLWRAAAADAALLLTQPGGCSVSYVQWCHWDVGGVCAFVFRDAAGGMFLVHIPLRVAAASAFESTANEQWLLAFLGTCLV